LTTGGLFQQQARRYVLTSSGKDFFGCLTAAQCGPQLIAQAARWNSATGHTVLGIVRNPEHVDDVRATGPDAVALSPEADASTYLSV
jgi:hypothetical protein